MKSIRERNKCFNGIVASMFAVALVTSAVAADKPAVTSQPMSPPVMTAPGPFAMGAPVAKIPTPDVALADVDGEKLMSSQVDEQIAQVRTSAAGRMPERVLEQRLAMLRRNMAEEFVAKTLLNREAAKMSVAITDKDIDEAITFIKSKLPEGITLEQAMKSRNMSEADLRKNLSQEIKIKKVIEANINTNQVVTEVEAKAVYQQEKERFQMPESVRARHILVKVEQDDAAKVKAEKKAKIDDLRKKLLAGADFAALAKEHSDCPSGLSKGGDLGSFSRGQMVPPFENAAFSQPINEIGPVVETSFGYHIIQVTERNKDKTLSFEEVKDKIIDGIKMKREQEAFKDYLQTLKAKAKIVYHESVTPVEPLPAMRGAGKPPAPMPMNSVPKATAPAGK